MDERFRGHLGSINEIQIRSQRLSVFPDEAISNFKNQNLVAAPRLEYNSADHSFDDFNFLPPDPTPSNIATVSSENHDGEDSPEDPDFLDEVLRYINKVLMEEDVEEMTCMLKDSIELQAAEKSFSEVLGKKYPPSDAKGTNFFNAIRLREEISLPSLLTPPMYLT